jgi:hypothetical protein
MEPIASSDREMLLYLMKAFENETWVCDCCGHEEDTATMDSAKLLREYLLVYPEPINPYKQALQNISDGNYPHPTRLEKCPHDRYHWEGCENCIDEYIDSVLAATPTDNEKPEDYEAIKLDAVRYRWLKRDSDLAMGAPFIARMTALGAFSRWTEIHADEAIDAAMSDCPHPSIQEPRSNCPKSLTDPYDTIEQQDFIQKGK